MMRIPIKTKKDINPMNDPNVGGKNGMICPFIEKILEVSTTGETNSCSKCQRLDFSCFSTINEFATYHDET